MSTVARRFLASPARLSSAAWTAISKLVCDNDIGAAAEFAKVSGIGSCLVNDQVFAQNPMVVKNKGPRLRVYCLYGDDAISGEDQNEDALSWKPTTEEWHVFLPCFADEIDEMAAALKSKSEKFSVYDLDKGIPDDASAETEKSASSEASVDWRAFKKL